MSRLTTGTNPRRWMALGVLGLIQFMLVLDITVVNVALPDIQRSLHSSFRDLQWVINAYSLTLAAFLLTAGALGAQSLEVSIRGLRYGVALALGSE